MAVGPAQNVGQFSSPYPDLPPTQALHNLFHDAQLVHNTWLNEEGSEFRLPPKMVDDQNWSSKCTQDFWCDIDATRSNKAPVDNFWGISLDDNITSSKSGEPDAAECEMPGVTISESGSNKFAPYTSKTVSIICPIRARGMADSYHATDVYFRPPQ